MPQEFLFMPITKLLNVSNINKRRFNGWASVEMVDSDGEYIPREEIKKNLNDWMERGAPISDTHSNRIIGKGLNWWFSNKVFNGMERPGIMIESQLYDNNPLDDFIWEKIKKRYCKKCPPEELCDHVYRGYSIGGFNLSGGTKNVKGREIPILKDMYTLEVAVCPRPSNMGALFEEINTFAKSNTNKGAECERVLVERGFSQEDAYNICYADEIAQNERNPIKTMMEKMISKSYKYFQKPFGPYKNFEDCVRSQSQKEGVDNPEAACAAIMRRAEGNPGAEKLAGGPGSGRKPGDKKPDAPPVLSTEAYAELRSMRDDELKRISQTGGREAELAGKLLEWRKRNGITKDTEEHDSIIESPEKLIKETSPKREVSYSKTEVLTEMPETEKTNKNEMTDENPKDPKVEEENKDHEDPGKPKKPMDHRMEDIEKKFSKIETLLRKLSKQDGQGVKREVKTEPAEAVEMDPEAEGDDVKLPKLPEDEHPDQGKNMPKTTPNVQEAEVMQKIEKKFDELTKSLGIKKMSGTPRPLSGEVSPDENKLNKGSLINPDTYIKKCLEGGKLSDLPTENELTNAVNKFIDKKGKSFHSGVNYA